MKSDQINICCLNSPFKVNMDFYHIKPKPMSQRFCAWILLANRKIILSDGRLRVLFLAGARQAALRLQGELWVLLRVPLLWHVCSPCAWESHLFLQPFTLYPCPLFLYFRYAVSPKLQKHIERSRPDHQCSSGHPCLLLNMLLVGWVIPLPLTLWTGNYRVLLFFFFLYCFPTSWL